MLLYNNYYFLVHSGKQYSLSDWSSGNRLLNCVISTHLPYERSYQMALIKIGNEIIYRHIWKEKSVEEMMHILDACRSLGTSVRIQ